MHTDVKPKNLLIQEDHSQKIEVATVPVILRQAFTGTSTFFHINAKLGDLGSVTPMESTARGASNPLCTPCYQAPELIEGLNHWTGAVDLWGAGVTLFEFVTGKVNCLHRPSPPHHPPLREVRTWLEELRPNRFLRHLGADAV